MSIRASTLLIQFAAALLVLGGLIAAPSNAGASPAAAGKLENAGCLECHDAKKEKIEVLARDGEMRELGAIDPRKTGKGAHARLDCVDCHTNITDNEAPHKKTVTLKLDCAQCHEALWNAALKDGSAKDEPRLERVVRNIEAYKKSFHARPDQDDPTRPKATCEQCHDTHSFNVPAKGSDKHDAWRRTVPELCGKSCHEDQLEDFNESVHGVELLEKKNAKSAECSNCHTPHDIAGTSASPTKLLITQNCGNCHEENYRTYRATYHGQVATLGFAYTAKCFDCHGSHGIQKVDDPESKVHPDKRLKTCKKCHDGKKMPEATAGFVSFQPHAHSGDRKRYPEVWLVSRFMLGLLVFVFAYFWAHSLLWWRREYKDRKEGKGRPHIRTLDALGSEGQNKHVRRFGLIWRIGHLLFALSVMALILTGMAVFYAETAWAPVVASVLGGPKVMGIIHRTSAAIMLGIFFLHLIGVSINIVRNWKTFRFFGPNSLVPRWQDFKDAWGMFKWFVGKGPRPVFDRWTYWEKFDYWAVFWGMAIIGGSGLLLTFPHVTASFLPGWVFNVATLVHGEEAFLAAVFLFTVHFFNNHFRPDKMPPPDVVMFTGVQSLEEFRCEHTVQYNRLVESGELEKYLVDAPSRPMTLGSKILGLTLIAIGLTLLVLVAIGFFGGK